MAEKRKRTSSSGKGGGIIANVVEQTSRVAGETTRIAGELLDSATSAANTARETGAEWVKGVSPTAAEVIKPGARKGKSAGGRAARQPRKTGAGKAAASATRTTNKAAKRTGKAAASATRAATRAAGRAAGSAQKAARTATTGRKGGAKKR